MKTSFRPTKAWSVTILLFGFMALSFLDKMSVGLLATPIMRDLGLTPVQFGLIGSSFFWLFAISGVLGGFLSNRMATNGLLLAMGVAWSVVQLPLAASFSLAVFVVCRVLLGATEGPATPIAIHACFKWFPDRKRNVPVAVVMAGATLGVILASLLILFVSARWGWRANFYMLAGAGIVWTLLWALIGDEGSLANPVKAETSNGIPYRKLLSDSTVAGCIIMRFVAYLGLSLVLTWFATYLERGLGFSAAVSGKLLTAIIIVNAPAAIVIAWVSQKMLARGVSSRAARGRVAGGLLIVGGAFFAALMIPGLSAEARFVVLALGWSFSPAIYSLGPAMIAEVVPSAQRGAVLAIDTSVSSIAGILAPLFAGYVIERVGLASGYELATGLFGAVSVLGGLIGTLMVNPERSKKRLDEQARTTAAVIGSAFSNLNQAA